MVNKELIKKAEEMLPKDRFLTSKPWLDELGRPNLTPSEQQENIADREYNIAIYYSRKALPAILAMWEDDLRERFIEKFDGIVDLAYSGMMKDGSELQEHFEEIEKAKEQYRDVIKSVLSTNPNKEV